MTRIVILSVMSLVVALVINVSVSLPFSVVDFYNYLTMGGNGGFADPTNTLFKTPREEHLLCEAISEPCFSYDRSSSIGPYCWGRINGHNTHCCDLSGSFQSPISIPRPKRTICTSKKLHYLNSSITGKVENNGIYPEFFSHGSQSVLLQGVPGTDANYIFDNIHIHSGVRGAYRQTENLLYGRSYNAEVHIVHHHSDFENLAEASKHPGGIVVVAIFLTNEEKRYNPTRSRALDKILNRLSHIIEFTEEEHVCKAENRRIKRTGIYSKLGVQRACRDNDPNSNVYASGFDQGNKKCLLYRKDQGCGDLIEELTFNPNDLLSSIPSYLTFEGGLTSPPCSESAIWIVAEHPAYISVENIEYMNKLQSRITNQTISDFSNLRPLHNDAGRDVFRIIYGQEESNNKENGVDENICGERGDGGDDVRDNVIYYDDDDYLNDDLSEYDSSVQDVIYYDDDDYFNDDLSEYDSFVRDDVDYYDDDDYFNDELYEDDSSGYSDDDDLYNNGRRDRYGGVDQRGRVSGYEIGGRGNGDHGENGRGRYTEHQRRRHK